MAYKITREKMVKQGGVLIDTRTDGSAHIQVHGTVLDLTEEQIRMLYKVIGDIIEYDDPE